jgi:hypothetical protein
MNSSFDLHVLGTPPTFILSQDQTLRKKFYHLKRCFVSLLADMLDLSRSTFIDEVCHLPITLQLLRYYLSPREHDSTQLVFLCQGFFSVFPDKSADANSRQHRPPFIAMRNDNVLILCSRSASSVLKDLPLSGKIVQATF